MNTEHQPFNKKVAITLSLTIPATGKSTVFNLLKQNLKTHNIITISSDDIKQQKILELVPNHKQIGKKQAGYIVKEQADAQYYREIQIVLEKIRREDYEHDNTVIFLDKNYSQVTLPSASQKVKQIVQKYPNLNVKIIGILPKCNRLLTIAFGDNQYNYPFSTGFVACCLKRVISRDQHPTLQGTKNYRASVCLGWANNFRNFSLKDEHLSKIFDGVIMFPFTKQQPLPMQTQITIIKILKQTKYGTFDEHVLIGQLVSSLSTWTDYTQNSPGQNLDYYDELLQDLFASFGNMEKYQISEVLKANHISI